MGLHPQYADELAALKHSQQERRVAIERERSLLAERHQQLRMTQQHEQRARRDTLRANYLKTVNEIRLARYINRPTGLAAFLGRVSGIEYIRKILHRRDDAKRLSAYGEALQTLKTQQAIEAKALDTRLKLQTQEVSRKQAALEKIDKRELAAFMRDQRTVQRVRSRDGGDAMPSLTELVVHSRTVEIPPRTCSHRLKGRSTTSQKRFPTLCQHSSVQRSLRVTGSVSPGP